jgi:hypothetical protein
MSSVPFQVVVDAQDDLMGRIELAEAFRGGFYGGGRLRSMEFLRGEDIRYGLRAQCAGLFDQALHDRVERETRSHGWPAW